MGMRLLGVALGFVLIGGGLVTGSPTRVSADELYCDGYIVTIVAQGGVTNGTRGNDVILGSDGDDQINGGSGDDVICDYEGTNVLHGNSGNDLILGSGTLYGDSGHDTLVAYDVTTFIDGGSGNDYIVDDSESGYVPVVRGGSGNDEIYLRDADSVFGDSGNDLIGIYDGEGRGASVASVGALDCGTGIDEYYAYNYDTIRRCENFSYLN